MRAPRVLVVHNRYRVEGGEERSVALQLDALRHAGVEHSLLERRSSEAGRGRAALALVRGGHHEQDVAAAVRELAADVAHAHNMLPLVGPRGLAAARDAGARVVLHLHNARLFCAIGVAARDGGPCFRCRGRLTLPGLALNCRGSLPEAVAYAAGLSLHQPLVLETVDRFLAPSRWAAGQLERLGVPGDRLEVLPHYLPEDEFAERSEADAGGYALIAARLSPEKGIDVAIRAAAAAGMPLRVAGEGPEADRLRSLAGALEAPVEFLGRVPHERMRGLLGGAACLVMPSRYHEFSPYSALEAMARGVPVIATPMGGLPELLGDDGAFVPLNDADALADRLSAMQGDAAARRREGERLLARARERHSRKSHVASLLSLYRRVTAG